MKPRLLILSYSPIHGDARVLKQVALFSDDYHVTTCGYGPPPPGAHEHVEIPEGLVHWQLNRKALITRNYAKALRIQEVNAHLARALPRWHFDAILANDAETVPLALSLKPRHGVHADLHEYAPRQKDGVPRWKYFVAPYVRWLCAHYLPRTASTTTITAHFAAEYSREFGIPEPGVVVNATPFREADVRPAHNPLRLVHSGAALPDRHIEIMIDAVGQTTADVRFDLYLTPNQPAYVEALRERAALRGNGRVRVCDPVPYARLVETLAGYDVGVFSIPPVSYNYRWTLPNKLFDFVQARLALVVSPSPEMRQIVEAHGLGVVALDFTDTALAAALSGLTPDKVRAFKDASHRAAWELSAESQTAPWRRAIDALVSGEHSP